MAAPDARAAVELEELIVEARRLAEVNRALRQRLRAQRLWRVAALALALAAAFYAWTMHTLLAENVRLLRANTELMQSGNALLRAANARQQEMRSVLDQMRRAPVDPVRPEQSRRRLDRCQDGSPGCDSPPTYWVPGFPGPRVSTKRTVLRPSM